MRRLFSFVLVSLVFAVSAMQPTCSDVKALYTDNACCGAGSKTLCTPPGVAQQLTTFHGGDPFTPMPGDITPVGYSMVPYDTLFNVFALPPAQGGFGLDSSFKLMELVSKGHNFPSLIGNCPAHVALYIWFYSLMDLSGPNCGLVKEIFPKPFPAELIRSGPFQKLEAAMNVIYKAEYDLAGIDLFSGFDFTKYAEDGFPAIPSTIVVEGVARTGIGKSKVELEHTAAMLYSALDDLESILGTLMVGASVTIKEWFLWLMQIHLGYVTLASGIDPADVSMPTSETLAGVQADLDARVTPVWNTAGSLGIRKCLADQMGWVQPPDSR